MEHWLDILILVGVAGLFGRWHYQQSQRTARRWVRWLVQEKE